MDFEFVDVTDPYVRATLLEDVLAAAHCSLLECVRYLCRYIAVVTRMDFGPRKSGSDYENGFGRASACDHENAFGDELCLGVGVGVVVVGGLQLLLRDALFLSYSWRVCGQCS